MAQFEFIVIHQKGTENVNADALSRSDQFEEPTKEEYEEYQLNDEVGEFKTTYTTDLDRVLEEIARERWKFVGYGNYGNYRKQMKS